MDSSGHRHLWRVLNDAPGFHRQEVTNFTPSAVVRTGETEICVKETGRMSTFSSLGRGVFAGFKLDMRAGSSLFAYVLRFCMHKSAGYHDGV